MVKRILYIALSLFVAIALCTSCRVDERGTFTPQVREGYLALHLNMDVPQMQEVSTRAVDPDGRYVQNMTLFCFDAYGFFITTVSASIDVDESGLEGSIDAQIPDNTRILHFVANQNMTRFPEDVFRNQSEVETMKMLEGSAGRIIYWTRFACDPADDANIVSQLSTQMDNHIYLIRNHAKISIENPTDNGYLEVTGFVVYNTSLFGTVAAYHPTLGFDFTWPGDDFITLPANTGKETDININININNSQYVFETENSSDDPVSVILRGHRPGQTESDDKYYRVMLVDDDGNQIPVRRNHHYKLNIVGNLSYGHDTFEEALVSPATNNIWIFISDEINEIEDNHYILTIEKTTHIIDGNLTGMPYSVSYTIRSKDGSPITASDAAAVSWVNNNVAQQGFDNHFEVVDGVGRGLITISTFPIGNNERLDGTLLVKKGRLQRKVKIVSLQVQSFAPSWVSTQVFGQLNQGRMFISGTFTIPETYPEELLPVQVLITAPQVDVRNASGMNLDVVRKGDTNGEFYGDESVDYKYLFVARTHGMHIVYLENILNQNMGTSIEVSIEAEHFEKMSRTLTFSESLNSLSVQGLYTYDLGSSSGHGIETAYDEQLHYCLVPQKKGAELEFDMLLHQGLGEPYSLFNAGPNDEFFLHSQYLSHSEPPPAGVTLECTFYPVESRQWRLTHEPQTGRLLVFKPIDPAHPLIDVGNYTLHLRTDRAKCAEVINLESARPGMPAVLAVDNDGSGMYMGNSYRSFIFELINYHPFRFKAQINGQGDVSVSGENPETLTDYSLSYQPDQSVILSFDVTDFMGEDNKSVDPFGQEFEIYIDAPMLSIDESALAAHSLNSSKLYPDPNVPGRFIYKVDADRTVEALFGTAASLGSGRTGERKSLPFKTNSIVTGGNIVISSNEEQVVYYPKTFKIENTPFEGTIKYRDNGGILHDVDASSFVAFERIIDDNRVGSLQIDTDGHYTVYLRKEYEFNWYSGGINIYYKDGNLVYSAIYPSLSDLYANPNIVLELVD